MRKFIMLIVWLILSYTSFSQGINPQIIEIDHDTHFCFSVPQSRILAKELIKSQYADSLEIQLDRTISLYRYQQSEMDSILYLQQIRIENTTNIVQNQREQIELLKSTLEQRDKKLKKNKLQKLALGVISTLTTIASVIALAK